MEICAKWPLFSNPLTYTVQIDLVLLYYHQGICTIGAIDLFSNVQQKCPHCNYNFWQCPLSWQAFKLAAADHNCFCQLVLLIPSKRSQVESPLSSRCCSAVMSGWFIVVIRVFSLWISFRLLKFSSWHHHCHQLDILMFLEKKLSHPLVALKV